MLVTVLFPSSLSTTFLSVKCEEDIFTTFIARFFPQTNLQKYDSTKNNSAKVIPRDNHRKKVLIRKCF